MCVHASCWSMWVSIIFCHCQPVSLPSVGMSSRATTLNLTKNTCPCGDTHTQSHTDASESVGANFHKVNLSCENVTLDCAVPSLYIWQKAKAKLGVCLCVYVYVYHIYILIFFTLQRSSQTNTALHVSSLLPVLRHILSFFSCSPFSLSLVCPFVFSSDHRIIF